MDLSVSPHDAAKRSFTNKTVRELPTEMRPREEMARRGARNVSDGVLLAILLRTGSRDRNVMALANEILAAANGLLGLAGMTHSELRALDIKGLGEVKTMELEAALELGRRAAQLAPSAETDKVSDAESVYRLLEPLTRYAGKEHFWVLLINAKNRLMERPIKISIGTADSSFANPREVLQPAIRHNAMAIIVAHNHPSGDPTPSRADIAVTKQLIEAGKIVGVRVLDHIIIGQPRQGLPGYVSIRQQKLANFG